MKMKNKVMNSIIITIGFLLSPLSWWNDIIINLPLAYLFSYPFSIINKSLFLPSFVLGYFLTNIAGLVMMHKGVNNLRDKKESNKKELIKDILISLGYVLLIVVLVLTGILKSPTEYLSYLK
jgi:hypothetical protein